MKLTKNVQKKILISAYTRNTRLTDKYLGASPMQKHCYLLSSAVLQNIVYLPAWSSVTFKIAKISCTSSARPLLLNLHLPYEFSAYIRLHICTTLRYLHEFINHPRLESTVQHGNIHLHRTCTSVNVLQDVTLSMSAFHLTYATSQSCMYRNKTVMSRVIRLSQDTAYPAYILFKARSQFNDLLISIRV